MIETIQINWLLLLAPLLWSLGIAVLLALAGMMEFLKAAKQISRRDFLTGTSCKRIGTVGFIFIACGLLLTFARIHPHQLIAVKLEKQQPIPLEKLSSATNIKFLPKDLKMDAKNKSHILNNEKMKNNTMALFWDGYIQTPFLQFRKGNYCVQFQAKGSKAKDEFSRIKVEFEVPGRNSYLETGKITYFELTNKMQPYSMDFQAMTDTIGRVRIVYFNDIYIPGTKKGRDVWVRELIIN